MTKKRIGLATFCIILGILFAYAMQQSPAPVLLEIQENYNIVNNDTLLNLCVSICYLSIVIACLIGAKVEQKIGLINLFKVTMIITILGGLLSLVSVNYYILLAARLIWGFGFGLGIQFIGSAIMKYYDEVSREKMNTLNGMFPFIGTVISFLIAAPLSNMLGGFKRSLAIWTIPLIISVVLWILFIKDDNMPDFSEKDETEQGGNVFKTLWGYKEIRLLCIIFVCDFICYSYVAVVVNTLFYEGTNMSLETAGLVSAVAFPAFGIIGSGLGGIILNKTGLRKPPLVIGQAVKFIGLCLTSLGAANPVLLIGGICLFGIGNGMWMPSLYCAPMDLEGMTPNLAGAAFAFMSAFGMTAGFFAPSLGGAITDALRASCAIAEPVAAHVFGLRWSLFIFGCMNIVSFICAIIFRETGKRR